MMTPHIERKRAAIVGTAESWRKCPWNDPDLYIASLNDAYMLGIPRVNEWAEYHPFNLMYFRTDRIVKASDIPPGYYVRPAGHLDWLKQQAMTIPVWLKDEPPDGWPPNAKRLPLEDLEAKYGTYWASGPSYMLMHLYDRGFREIHIYGIHLATKDEYVNQRPNFEALISRLLGPQVSMSVANGMRTYDGETGVRIVLPVEAPILQHGWRYAFDPKPKKDPDPLAEEWAAVQQEKTALIAALVNWPKGKPKTKQLERLTRLEIVELDIEQQRTKRAVVAQMGK